MEEEKPKTPTFDPRKKYRWEPNDEFVISGMEFNVLLNTTRAILNSPEGKLILTAQRTNDIAEQILARGVESGLVKEIEEPKTTK